MWASWLQRGCFCNLFPGYNPCTEKKSESCEFFQFSNFNFLSSKSLCYSFLIDRIELLRQTYLFLSLILHNQVVKTLFAFDSWTHISQVDSSYSWIIEIFNMITNDSNEMPQIPISKCLKSALYLINSLKPVWNVTQEKVSLQKELVLMSRRQVLSWKPLITEYFFQKIIRFNITEFFWRC